jgi:hypothetical protein
MTIECPPLDDRFATPAAEEQLDRAAGALRERGYTVHVVDTVHDARKLVGSLLPTDKGVFTANSETLRLSGIAADIEESGRFQSVRRQAAALDGDFAAQVKLGAAPDVVVGSVHAVTEDGYMVAASATGSQLAPYAAGAMTAMWVVGAQKVVPDLPTALRRVRTYSLPREWDRCQRAYGQPSFIGKILIFEREAAPGRGIVILVREPIGF